MLSDADLSRIADTVRAAEARTSGEVYCLLSQEVSYYREVPLAWASLAALVLPPIAVAAGIYGRVVDMLSGWSASHGVSDTAAIAGALTGYALMQAIVFASIWALTAIPAVRRAVTPGVLKAQRVRRLAEQLFIATGMKDDPSRTGVLIFAALAERRVEVLADAAIHAKAAPGAWDAAVRAVVDGTRANRCAEGFETAITLCGDALAQAFPQQGEGANRLSDRPSLV